MPSYKFISVRFEDNVPTLVYVDNMTAPKVTYAVGKLSKFYIEAPLVQGQTNKGATLRVEPMRWPPGQTYDAPLTLSLSAQWPFGMDLYKPSDTVGHTDGRSVGGVEFTYGAKKLSWNQLYQGPDIKLQGSVEFTATSPVWYVTLVLDDGTPFSVGKMLVNGADVS